MFSASHRDNYSHVRSLEEAESELTVSHKQFDSALLN